MTVGSRRASPPWDHPSQGRYSRWPTGLPWLGCVTLPISGNRSLKKTSSSATMTLVVSTTTSSVKVSARLPRWVEHRPYFKSLILSLSTSCSRIKEFRGSPRVKAAAAQYRMAVPCLTLILEVRQEVEKGGRHYQVIVRGSGDILGTSSGILPRTTLRLIGDTKSGFPSKANPAAR